MNAVSIVAHTVIWQLQTTFVWTCRYSSKETNIYKNTYVNYNLNAVLSASKRINTTELSIGQSECLDEAKPHATFLIARLLSKWMKFELHLTRFAYSLSIGRGVQIMGIRLKFIQHLRHWYLLRFIPRRIITTFQLEL